MIIGADLVTKHLVCVCHTNKTDLIRTTQQLAIITAIFDLNERVFPMQKQTLFDKSLSV